jgi:hypothetical protein
MLEVKEFYNFVSKKQNVQKIIQFAFNSAQETKTQGSQNAALSVLNTLVQLFHDKHKSSN